MKTLDCGVDNGGMRRRYLLGSIEVELRFLRFHVVAIGSNLSILFFSVYL